MMLGNDLNYLVLSFDLDTKKLKECYPKSRRSAYREIQQILESNGFEHRQWSGYVSSERMDIQELYQTIRDLRNMCPWLKDCINHFDVSETSDFINLDIPRQIISGEMEELSKKESVKEKKGPKLSLDGASGSLMDQFNKASEVAERSNAEIATKTKEEIGRE